LYKAITIALALGLLLFLMTNPAPTKRDVVTCPFSDTITKIHDIQGSVGISPLVGKTVSVQAVVTGDFSRPYSLGGFFLQEEDRDADQDPRTSEGIFVYSGDAEVAVMVGDLVCVTGTVAEDQGLTRLEMITQLHVCQTHRLPEATPVNLPFTCTDWPERVESMRIALPQKLVVTDTYNLGRYGELVLSSHRLFSATEVARPGESAQRVMAQNALNCLILDDGSSKQNPDPIVYPLPELTASNTTRAGDSVIGVEGILTYFRGEYMVEPTQRPTFISTNPRQMNPPFVAGQLRVASFNVENYFNGDGCGEGFPTTRGACTLTDFQRQRNKLLKALVAVNADIIGLVELENDGFGPTSAVYDLVEGMNAACPVGTTYAYVTPTSGHLETDEITMALVYRTQTVKIQGAAVLMPASDFPEMNRLPLAQTFIHKPTEERITVVVNHFKSKSKYSAHGLDRDQGDGQGCWNHNRVQEAEGLTGWLATDPTNAGDPDMLIIGDLNAYSQEDPIEVLVEAGYTDLLPAFSDCPESTYVYKGEAGALDHAFASSSLVRQVEDVQVWHINADEPSVLGYSSNYKSALQVIKLYRNDPFRSSDHDPLIVGIDLR
jgi:hypothetical protein